jgi:hypothetical protein
LLHVKQQLEEGALRGDARSARKALRARRCLPESLEGDGSGLLPIKLQAEEVQAVYGPPARITAGRLGDEHDPAHGKKRRRGLGTYRRGSESPSCNKVRLPPKLRVATGLLASLPSHLDAIIELERVNGLGEELGAPAVGVKEDPARCWPQQR